MDGGNGDREFEDRFLQCVGLVDPTPVLSGPTRTASEASAEERKLSLKRQAQTSPWYMYTSCCVYLLTSTFIHARVYIFLIIVCSLLVN